MGISAVRPKLEMAAQSMQEYSCFSYPSKSALVAIQGICACGSSYDPFQL